MSAHIISITNMKGGVGKSTTALNLGAALAGQDKRVLLLDNDVQGNMTAALGFTPAEQKYTLAKLLLTAIDSPEDMELHLPRTILHTESGMDLIPANAKLSDAAARLQVMQLSQYGTVGEVERPCEKVMAELLEPLWGSYDYIIIDCGLKHELLTVNALAAADYCIIPVQAHYLAMTLDDMSMARINRIIASLKDHSYQPHPARRVYIAKKNSSKKRPLGIPSADDKLVQEIIRMLLEAIYEPTFSKHSHGFRPNRSCHTALEDIEARFKGVKWVVEGDIEACFDSFDHHVLIDLLRKRIKDEQFIALMWKFLKAGYMEQWTYQRTYSGTPQGSGMSPVLANIYLSELDKFLERYTAQFNTPEKRRSTSEEHGKARYQYRKATHALQAERTPETVAAFKQAQKHLLDTPYRPVMETDYKRLQYCRYADDFVVGVVGSKADAEQVKADIGHFLADELKLTLSEKKTMVTHSGDLIRFLGYDFTVSRNKHAYRSENGVMQRFHYGKVRFYVPHEKWLKKLLEYKTLKIYTDEKGNEKWKSIHRGILINKTDVEIVSKYNSEIRGLYNFYRMAVNVSVLNKFYFIMKGSMVRTLACKYKTSFKEITRRYAKDGVFCVQYEGKAGMKTCEFYHDGFTMQRSSGDLTADTLPQYRKYDKPNSLASRLRGGVCEMCGAKTDEIHMHHVKSLKSLTSENIFEARMLNMRRRSLALCGACYEDLKSISSK